MKKSKYEESVYSTWIWLYKLIKTRWSWRSDRQRNRIDHLEIDPHKYVQQISYKGAKVTQWRKTCFFKITGAGATAHHRQSTSPTQISYPIAQAKNIYINSKWITGKLKHKTFIRNTGKALASMAQSVRALSCIQRLQVQFPVKAYT